MGIERGGRRRQQLSVTVGLNVVVIAVFSAAIWGICRAATWVIGNVPTGVIVSVGIIAIAVFFIVEAERTK